MPATASSWCSATALAAFEGDGEAVQRVRTRVGQGRRVRLRRRRRRGVPNVELGQRAGLDTDNGILVDPQLQTSAPGIFAAGDVANHWHPFYERRVRVEHWANAQNQGTGRRPLDARQREGLQGAALLLLRSVRRRHGVLGAARRR